MDHTGSSIGQILLEAQVGLQQSAAATLVPQSLKHGVIAIMTTRIANADQHLLLDA